MTCGTIRQHHLRQLLQLPVWTPRISEILFIIPDRAKVWQSPINCKSKAVFYFTSSFAAVGIDPVNSSLVRLKNIITRSIDNDVNQAGKGNEYMAVLIVYLYDPIAELVSHSTKRAIYGGDGPGAWVYNVEARLYISADLTDDLMPMGCLLYVCCRSPVCFQTRDQELMVCLMDREPGGGWPWLGNEPIAAPSVYIMSLTRGAGTPKGAVQSMVCSCWCSNSVGDIMIVVRVGRDKHIIFREEK